MIDLSTQHRVRMKKKNTLGIIAGAGDVPALLVNHCIKNYQPFYLLGIKGFVDENLIKKTSSSAIISMGQIGKAVKLFKANRVKEIVFIGAVKRPNLALLKFDLKGIILLFKIWAKFFGDNSLLSSILKYFETQGFKVVGIDDILKDMVVGNKLYTKTKPDKTALADIARGVKILYDLSKHDIGQAIVVEKGIVLGIEAIEGTQALIERSKALGCGKAVLIKTIKSKQDRRVDLPTIGENTIKQAHAAHIKGIAITAGSSIIINKERVIALANKFKMFVVGINVKDYLK